MTEARLEPGQSLFFLLFCCLHDVGIGILIFFIKNTCIFFQLLLQVVQVTAALLCLLGCGFCLESSGGKGCLCGSDTSRKVVLNSTNRIIDFILHGIDAIGNLHTEIIYPLLGLLTILQHPRLKVCRHLYNLVVRVLLNTSGLLQHGLTDLIDNFLLTLLGLGQGFLVGRIVLSLQLLGPQMELVLQVFQTLAFFHGFPRGFLCCQCSFSKLLLGFLNAAT